VYFCNTLFLESDCTVSIDRTGVAVPKTPLFWDFTIDSIEASCMAPMRADVAGDAEAIIEEKITDMPTYTTDSICVVYCCWHCGGRSLKLFSLLRD